jgi:hypothetical protein
MNRLLLNLRHFLKKVQLVRLLQLVLLV